MDKAALVTGGSSGIGFAIATMLRESGFELTIAGRTRAKVEAAAEQLRDALSVLTSSSPLLVARQRAPQQVGVAAHDHQKVVEIVRDATGELAETLELLHLVKLSERDLTLAGALLDALLELEIGALELSRTFQNALLELAVQGFELTGLAIEFRKHLDLGAQHLRHDGHRNIVDRTHFVATQPVDVADLDGGGYVELLESPNQAIAARSKSSWIQ